jgi:hypothetical protein
MGAHDFTYVRKGLNPHELFNEIVDREREEYGYSSGFSNKGGLQKVSLPDKIKNADIEKYIDDLLQTSKYGDKYGPVFYIEVLKTSKEDVKELAGSTVTKPETGNTWYTAYVLKYFEKYEREVIKESKTEALSIAKGLAEKGHRVTITIEKRLRNKNNVLAVVEPKYKTVKKYVNTYYFFGFVPE